jgi:DNA polymerase-1
MQTLQGDSVDGYKGCPGIGPKKAEKILADSTDPWGDIVSAYMGKGLTEDDALVQAQVARICQHQNYNYDTAEVIPWTPEEIA